MKWIQFTFIPHITLKQPHTIGDVTFWPYHERKNEYLNEIPEAIPALDEVAKCFKDNYHKRPLPRISAATLTDNKKLERSYPEQQEKIADAVNLLAYIGTTKQSNYSRLFYDNYTPQTFNRDLDTTTDIISFNSRAGINAMDMKDAWILNPYHIHIQEADSWYDKELSEAFDNLYNRAYHGPDDEQEEARRIMRAIGWFNISKYSDPLISDQMMHAALAVALEALLDIPNVPRKTEALSHSIQLLCGQSEKIEKWAKDFYGLRNRILHGEKVASVVYGENNSHIALTQIVFDHCLRIKLSLMRLWPDGPISPNYLLRRLDYYLGDNKERLTEILKFKYQDLKDEKKLFSFLKLAFSINDETDRSGDSQLYERAMRKVAELLEAGLPELEAAREKYIGDILDFDTEIADLRTTLGEIKGGNFSKIQGLSVVDIRSVSPGEEFKFQLQAKHLLIADGKLQITNLYMLLNTLLKIHEEKELEVRRRQRT